MTPLRHELSALVLGATLGIGGGAFAQNAPVPAAMEAEVVAVEGDEVTAALSADDAAAKKFGPVKVGDKLPKGSVISTGVKSTCKLKFPTATVKVEAITTTAIDRLGMVDDKDEPGAKKMDTKLNLKFGTVKYQVLKGALKTDMKISTPNSTTAIAGSWGGKESFVGDRDVGFSGDIKVVHVVDSNFGKSAVAGGEKPAGGEKAGGEKGAEKAAEASAPESAAAATTGTYIETPINNSDIVDLSVGSTPTEVTVVGTVSDFTIVGSTTTEVTSSVDSSAGGTVTTTTDSTSGTSSTSVSTTITQSSSETFLSPLPAPPGPPPF